MAHDLGPPRAVLSTFLQRWPIHFCALAGKKWCHALHAARSIESIEGGGGPMMVGVAPPMVTNPPDGVMALPAGRLHTKPAPRASPATQSAPKAPIGTPPPPNPTPRGATRTPIWPWPRRMWGSGAEKTLETLCYKSPKGPGNGRVWYLAPGNRCVYRRFLALKTT